MLEITTKKAARKWAALVIDKLFRCVGKQSNMPCALDGLCQLTLMHGACAGHPAGKDLAPVRNVLAELGCIFEIDRCYFIYAELADLPAASVVSGTLRTLGALRTLCSFFCLHFYSSF